MNRASATRTDAGRFTWRLDADLDAVPIARRAFETWLRDADVVDDDVHDLAVVLSELAANAANGAATGTQARIEAHIERRTDHRNLHLDVANHVDPATAEVRRWDLDDELRGGGRGLLIVRAYTDSMDIDTDGSQVFVRCTRRLERKG